MNEGKYLSSNIITHSLARETEMSKTSKKRLVQQCDEYSPLEEYLHDGRSLKKESGSALFNWIKEGSYEI